MPKGGYTTNRLCLDVSCSCNSYMASILVKAPLANIKPPYPPHTRSSLVFPTLSNSVLLLVFATFCFGASSHLQHGKFVHRPTVNHYLLPLSRSTAQRTRARTHIQVHRSPPPSPLAHTQVLAHILSRGVVPFHKRWPNAVHGAASLEPTLSHPKPDRTEESFPLPDSKTPASSPLDSITSHSLLLKTCFRRYLPISCRCH
ncbi:hypothetical protein M501DRAFT_831 [Patellaria atrata CBS 101060]|uniref:Uncharacterized protein n=1 Tax=Patellaria atrata CBS 101060 TaxID=1346257 RepID=A0A9P4SIT4_9PEZI|nr:hypothetical protein M501DRAFT_831 [Patellaria atrata CBS 101060]